LRAIRAKHGIFPTGGRNLSGAIESGRRHVRGRSAAIWSKTTAAIWSKTTAAIWSKTTAAIWSKTTAAIWSKTTAAIWSKMFSSCRNLKGMRPDALRALQAPLKTQYKTDPTSAIFKLKARGILGKDGVTCEIQTGMKGPVIAGLHPAAGGDGPFACAADMLLESLVACAGVTLNVVATSLAIPVKGGTITAEGDIDFRGTLGVSKDVPVGFTAIKLKFELDTEADDATVNKLIALTERYCVVYQTLKATPPITLAPLVKGRPVKPAAP
jgi:uncharacterized OsmC-like protein